MTALNKKLIAAAEKGFTDCEQLTQFKGVADIVHVTLSVEQLKGIFFQGFVSGYILRATDLIDEIKASQIPDNFYGEIG